MLWLLLEQETIVWHREYCTGRYWLDFYCPTAKVAIEVDGGSHLGREARVHDAERDGWHAERGIVTHRFSADQVERDGQGVLREIRKLVRMRLGLEEELSAATASAALPDPVRPAASSGPRARLGPRPGRRLDRPRTLLVARLLLAPLVAIAVVLHVHDGSISRWYFRGSHWFFQTVVDRAMGGSTLQK